MVLARHSTGAGRADRKRAARTRKRGSPGRPGLESDGMRAGVGAQKSCPPRTQEGNFSRSPIVRT